MDTNHEEKTGQTRPQPESDRRMETSALLNVGRGLPEGFWPRGLAVWGYASTPPFFAAFRDRPVR